MRISGIIRVRNEEDIIWNTLVHVANLVDDIYVFDDCSNDNTVSICRSHFKVKKVIRNDYWRTTSAERYIEERRHRQILYQEAIKEKPDYIYCFDADEFADFEGIDFTADYYRLRLYDFYITPKDIDKTWKEREWMGPEYRDILMLFKPTPRIQFREREPVGVGAKGKKAGFVKHFSKAISVERWEQDCDYYSKYFPRYAKKWENRKGKAIHTASDWGRPLIKWEDRFKTNVFIK